MCPKEYADSGEMANDICVRFGKRIQRLRKQRGLKQIDLAVHTGLSRAYISKIECGKKEPCLRAIEFLAVGLDVSMGQLFSKL